MQITVSFIMWGITMLTTEMKRQVFLKLRTENYRASLRLEGLEPRPVNTNKPTEKPGHGQDIAGHARLERPAYDFPIEQIQHNRQIQPAFVGPQIGDV